jgi:hypothetical protein
MRIHYGKGEKYLCKQSPHYGSYATKRKGKINCLECLKELNKDEI